MTRLILLSLVGMLCASSASATLTFYMDDPVGFGTAVTGLTFLGTEDFESSTEDDTIPLDDPLAPGVANGPFPSGTNVALGVTIQSNTLGASPASPSPRGNEGLVTFADGYFGTLTDQIGNKFEPDSLDMIISPFVLGVSFVPIYAASAGVPFEATLTVRVYDPLNNLIGTDTIFGGNYQTKGSFVGVVATGLDTIGRINLDDGSSSLDWVGFDDISAYSSGTTVVPEPSTFGLMILGGLALAALRARKRFRRS